METKERLNHRFGPFYTAKKASETLSISPIALELLSVERRVVRVTTADEVALYPVFQFTETGAMLPKLEELLHLLSDGPLDEWTILYWLTAKAFPESKYERIIDAFIAEDAYEIGLIFELAHNDARLWRLTR